jgi:hypothetical protein
MPNIPKKEKQQFELQKGGQAYPKKQEEWFDDNLDD